MSTTVCKFFLQGTCRFGNNCKFLHSTESSNSGNAFNRFAEPNRFNYLNPDEKLKQKMKQKVASVESNAEILQNDFKNWLPSKVWPFSCYSMNGIEQLFPELKDLSVDEARFAFYSARNSGSVSQHIQEITHEGQKIQQLIEQVSKANKNDIINLIRQKIGTDTENSITAANHSNTTVQQSSSSSIFGNPSGVSNPFTRNNPHTASFGSQSVFPANNSTSVLSSNTSSAFGSLSNNKFGSSTKSNIESNSGSSNIFKSSAFANPTTVSNNPFLSAASNPVSNSGSGNVFGSSVSSGMSAFGTNSNPGFGTPSFGQPAFGQSNTSQSTFGQSSFNQLSANEQHAFSQSTTSQPVFGISSPGHSTVSSGQSVFGKTSSALSAQPNVSSNIQVNKPTMFNTETAAVMPKAENTTTSTTSIPNSSAPFGGISSSVPSNNPFASASIQPKNIEEDLSRIPKMTEENLVQYKSSSFEWGKIPECPPPPELCF